MSMIDKMLALIGIKTFSITLIGHEREGGYIYLNSPDLPGFTFMLNPGEDKSIRTLINAIEEPLSAYLEAHENAQVPKKRGPYKQKISN